MDLDEKYLQSLLAYLVSPPHNRYNLTTLNQVTQFLPPWLFGITPNLPTN